MRAFHHGAILVNTKAGIRTPKDLEGKRVGVNRGYTVTTGVWARGVLQEEHGVDLSQDHLGAVGRRARRRIPAAVQRRADRDGPEDGRTCSSSGELVAAIGVEIDHPDVKPLIPNALDAGLDGAARARPLPDQPSGRDQGRAAREATRISRADVFDAFAESKRLYVERLKAGAIEKPTGVDKVHQRVMEITGGDPLPYGIEPNRKVLEEPDPARADAAHHHASP